MAERTLYINGKYSVLYGFDWQKNEAIYRQAIEVGGHVKAIYVRVSLEK